MLLGRFGHKWKGAKRKQRHQEGVCYTPALFVAARDEGRVVECREEPV